ncbi:MAG: hypothetical protein L6R35_002943 [Caloplaca aegaea]|nr:MAG: hypothetical protein L6R35_002943 [Caloplaca aegaea]
MASSIQDSQVFKRLTDLLDDHEGVNLLLTYPKQSLERHLTEQQRSVWSMIFQHYSYRPTVNDSDEDNDDNQSDENDEPQHEADAFLACFQYTLHLQSRGAKDRIRWLFSMLFYNDLAQLWHLLDQRRQF